MDIDSSDLAAQLYAAIAAEAEEGILSISERTKSISRDATGQ